MLIARIHQEIKSSVNKLDSNNYIDLPPEMIDDIINYVENKYVEDLAFGYNRSGYNYGFEVDGQRIDMLQSLVKSTDLSQTSSTILAPDCVNVTFDLPDDYRHYVRLYYESDCKVQPIEIIQHYQLNTHLKDSYKKPSKIWQRALCVIKDNTISVYAPEDFSTLKLDYIKNPKPVFFGNYDTLEFTEGDLTAYNSASLPTTSEIPETFHYLLVELCAQEIFKRLLSTKEN